jgi:hypothetical protein
MSHLIIILEIDKSQTTKFLRFYKSDTEFTINDNIIKPTGDIDFKNISDNCDTNGICDCITICKNDDDEQDLPEIGTDSKIAFIVTTIDNPNEYKMYVATKIVSIDDDSAITASNDLMLCDNSLYSAILFISSLIEINAEDEHAVNDGELLKFLEELDLLFDSYQKM